MEKLRKILIVIFSVLCVFFAWEAYLQKHDKSAIDSIATFAWETYAGITGEDIKLVAADWGSPLCALARKSERLIFVKIDRGEGVSDYMPSRKAEKILSGNYICTLLDKNAFPADYGLLKRVANGDINFAILSPNGYPLLAAFSFDADPESQNSAENVFARAAWAYQKRKSEMKSGVRVALVRAGEDKPTSSIMPTFVSRKRDTLEISNMHSLFADKIWANSPAVLTENARLAARLAADGNPAAKEAAKTAFECLYALATDRGANFSPRLLSVRAMSEFAMLFDDENMRGAFKAASLEILASQRVDGLFGSSTRISVGENALAISVMARASKIFKDGLFGDAMRKASSALSQKLKNYSTLPSVFAVGAPDIRSEASALDYVLLARAYMDVYFEGGNNLDFISAKKTLKKLDELFLDPATGLWFENSKKSFFAPFHYRLMVDREMPSVLGEAMQLLCDIDFMSGEISQRLVKISSSLNHVAAPEAFLDRASLKLSSIANPMRLSFRPGFAVLHANTSSNASVAWQLF